MKFTKEQIKAIEERGNNILVSAAAGSGKTSVLVERIIQKVIKDRVNIDELLVVTFTNAAATEMKERIIARIEKELETNKDDDFLKEQLIRINKAQISTIDAFCLKLVKENFKELDIEPSFRIGDSNEIEILKNEILEEFLEIQYNEEEKEFFDVLDAFSKKSDDTAFKEIFLKVYEQSQNSPYPKEWLEKAYEQYKIETESDFFNSDIFKKIIQYGKEALEEALKIKKYIDKLLLNEEKAEKVISFLENEFNQYKEALFYLEEENFKGFYEAFRVIKYETFRTTSLKENPILKEEITELRNTVKKLINGKDKSDKNCIKEKFFNKNIETILEENKKIYPIMKKFCSLIIEFDKYFLDIKKEKNIYTFNDIAHFCLHILKNNKNIALDYKERFNEIITDEYQDSNLIQEEILSSISKENNRFMVGDIKQCIYRFRQANPKIFNEKYLGYENGELAGKRIDLNANFRSNKNVIESINFIFEKIMSRELGEVEYDEKAKLKKITEDNLPIENINVPKNCELYIIDTAEAEEDTKSNDLAEELEELNKLEIEAHFIAKKIKNMIFEEKLHIFKDGGYFPIDYRDIVILSRNNQFSPILSKVFDEYEIPIYATGNKGFFEIIEITIILNILKIIDNPLQDIPLISVLYSSIFNFSANELLEIKLKGSEKLYYNCILNYINENNKLQKNKNIIEKIDLFLEKIKRWSELSKVLSINELLYRIYKETNYYNYVGLLKNGNIRQANLFSLLEKAIAFEKTNLQGIFAFIKYIEKIKMINDKDGEANISSENENVVRVMTIHKSKGLEFPIVFISGLSKKFNEEDAKGDILFDPEYTLGVSIKVKEENEDEFYPRYTINSIQKNIIKEKNKRESYSEELRVFYVALTRAKEKLILTGTTNKLETIKNKIISSNIINEKLILNNLLIQSHSYFDWVYSVLKSFENETHWKIYTEKKEDILLGYNINTETTEEKIKFEQLFDLKDDISDNYEYINNSLNWKYPYEIDKNLETSLTVSEIKRKFQLNFSEQFSDNIKGFDLENEEFDKATYNLPKFYKGEDKEISALTKGTLYHTILEHIDMDINDLNEIEKFINNLQMQGIITEEEKEILDKEKILAFLNSNLVRRIKQSSFIKKEIPFKLGLKASEIYSKEGIEKSDSFIIINGIIDLLFEEDGEIILVDYKTDKQTSKNVLKKRYETQLDIYKKAIEKATGKKVKECILYLILAEKEVII